MRVCPSTLRRSRGTRDLYGIASSSILCLEVSRRAFPGCDSVRLGTLVRQLILLLFTLFFFILIQLFLFFKLLFLLLLNHFVSWNTYLF
jgi:hypothetical protein